MFHMNALLYIYIYMNTVYKKKIDQQNFSDGVVSLIVVMSMDTASLSKKETS
jgi:hypothetical protein